MAVGGASSGKAIISSPSTNQANGYLSWTTISSPETIFSSRNIVAVNSQNVGQGPVGLQPLGNQLLYSGHLLPTSDAAYDLGKSSSRFRQLYCSAVQYNPADSSQWPTALIPSNIGGALDTMARFLKVKYPSDWPNFT